MLSRLQACWFSAAALFLTAASGLSAATQLQLSASSIGPVYVAPNTNGSSQSVQAFNGGTGTLNLSVATSASWLAASVGSPATCTEPGGTCSPINISLNTSTLAAGSYTEYVTVQSPDVIDSPQQISVNVVVASVPGSVTLYAAPNGGTASADVYPHSAVTGAVSTQSGGNWLSFTAPPAGQTGFGAPYSIAATAQTGQAPGTYTGSVKISGSTYAAGQYDSQCYVQRDEQPCHPDKQLSDRTDRLHRRTRRNRVGFLRQHRRGKSGYYGGVRRNEHGEFSQCLGQRPQYDPDYRQPVLARRRHLHGEHHADLKCREQLAGVDSGRIQRCSGRAAGHHGREGSSTSPPIRPGP